MSRILIVEDEEKLAALMADYLANSGYQCHVIANGVDVLPWLHQYGADLVLLDLMLPGKDGLDICRDIRQFSQIPIIMVTARIEEVDRLLGLELGADDYICKPFSPREMVARVKAVLRRLDGKAQIEQSKFLTLDANRLQVRAGQRTVELTSVEFQLLQTLYQQPGRVFSRARLMDRIYPDQRIVSDRTIDSHIKKIRKKMDELAPGLELIHSVYGAGYRFEMPIESQD